MDHKDAFAMRSWWDFQGDFDGAVGRCACVNNGTAQLLGGIFHDLCGDRRPSNRRRTSNNSKLEPNFGLG